MSREEEGATYKLKPIDLSNYKKLDENNGLAPYFRDVIRDELKKWCKDHKNPATGDPYDLYEDGLRIYTTINPRMQLYAEEAVAKQVPSLQKVLNAQTIHPERTGLERSYQYPGIADAQHRTVAKYGG